MTTACMRAVLRLAVAVDAPQVAPAGAVPHDDGLLIGRELKEVARQALALGAVAEHIARLDRAAIEFGYSDHLSPGNYQCAGRICVAPAGDAPGVFTAG